MKTAVFSARPYDRRFLEEANARDHSGQGFEFAYFDVALDASTVGWPVASMRSACSSMTGWTRRY